MGKKYPGTIPLNSNKTAWMYRLKMTLPNGEKIDTTCKKNEQGHTFSTAEEAYKAREAHKARLRNSEQNPRSKRHRNTLRTVYEAYLESDEAKSKAPATLAKQRSMWTQHISSEFGEKTLEEITLQHLQDYLFRLYNSEGYAFKYVEGFLKFFYLLYGYAYRMDLISYEKYLKMFVDRGTRLTMPEMTQADFEESEGPIETFNDLQLYQLEDLFKNEDGNLLPAFYLGLYCGLRISEVFALRWRCIDWQASTITINRQLHNIGGELKLSPVKTLTSVRRVLMPKILQNYLFELYQEQQKQKQTLGISYKNTERVLDEMLGEVITGGDFINRKKNGELLTVNSLKYYSKKIKAELGFEFKFHTLRHTFASNCAARNVNLQMLMEMMGHKKLETTRRYYISTENPDLKKRTLALLDDIFKPREQELSDGSRLLSVPVDLMSRKRTEQRLSHIPTKKE